MTAAERLSAIMQGSRRARLLPTLLIAGLVTAAVALPLWFRAAESEPVAEPTADVSLVTVDTATAEPIALDGSVLSGDALISFVDPNALGVSFNLFQAGTSEPLISSTDLEGPSFDLQVDKRGLAVPLDTSELENGSYELFLTTSLADGEQRGVVVFEVTNP